MNDTYICPESPSPRDCEEDRRPVVEDEPHRFSRLNEPEPDNDNDDTE